MNINKLLKPVLPAVMVLSTGLFIASCSSSDDDSPATPPTPPPVPTDGINGIWSGKFTFDTNAQNKDLDVTMLFYMPDDGMNEGTTGGAAFDAADTDPSAQFLFEGGYSYSATATESNPVNTGTVKVKCEADVYAVGSFGSQGTFVQEFDYETGSAAGPEQRGSGCFYLRDDDGDGYKNELTGQVAFEDGGKFTVAMTYSEENTRAVTVSDLGTTATDDTVYHLWSNDNSGVDMKYTSSTVATDAANLAVVETRSTNDGVNCGTNVDVTQVPGHNLFILETNPDVSGCTVTQVGVQMPELSNKPAQDVNFTYLGLGALFDTDDDGNLEFIHLMASKGSGQASDPATTQALYNRFAITP